MNKTIPSFDSLMNPLLNALFDLGGSGSIDEIYKKVLELEGIGEEISSIPHNAEKSNQTEVAYRLAWARTYLKKYDFLENSSRGIWTLTQLAKEKKTVITQEVVKVVRGNEKKDSKQKKEFKDKIELNENESGCTRDKISPRRTCFGWESNSRDLSLQGGC